MLVAAYRITLACGNIVCLFAAVVNEIRRVGGGFFDCKFCNYKRVSKIVGRTVCPTYVGGIFKRNRYGIITRIGLLVAAYRVTLVFGDIVCLFAAVVNEIRRVGGGFFKFDFSYRNRYVNEKFAVTYDNVSIAYGKHLSVLGLISNRVIGYFDITANTFTLDLHACFIESFAHRVSGFRRLSGNVKFSEYVLAFVYLLAAFGAKLPVIFSVRVPVVLGNVNVRSGRRTVVVIYLFKAAYRQYG